MRMTLLETLINDLAEARKKINEAKYIAPKIFEESRSVEEFAIVADLEELNDRICDIYQKIQEVLREREEKENE